MPVAPRNSCQKTAGNRSRGSSGAYWKMLFGRKHNGIKEAAYVFLIAKLSSSIDLQWQSIIASNVDLDGFRLNDEEGVGCTVGQLENDQGIFALPRLSLRQYKSGVRARDASTTLVNRDQLLKKRFMRYHRGPVERTL